MYRIIGCLLTLACINRNAASFEEDIVSDSTVLSLFLHLGIVFRSAGLSKSCALSEGNVV